MRNRIKTLIIFFLIVLIALMPIYVYIISPYLKSKPKFLSSKTIIIKLTDCLKFSDPIVSCDFEDLSGWKIEKGNVSVTSKDYFRVENSLYITSNEEFIISQKLSNNTITFIKGREVFFSFWFKPLNASKKGTLNYAWAEIRYRIGQNVTSVFGAKVYPREVKWYCAFVVAQVPNSSEEVFIVIHGNSLGNKGFNGYVDTAFLGLWNDLKAGSEKGQIALSTIIPRYQFDWALYDVWLGLGFFVKSLKPETYIIKSVKIEVKIRNPDYGNYILFYKIAQANDKNLAADGKEVLRDWRGLWAGSLASFCKVSNATIRAVNSTSDIYFSFCEEGHFKDLRFYKVNLDKEICYECYTIGGFAEWKYSSEWGKNCSKYVVMSLGVIEKAYISFSKLPKNISMSLTVNWGEIVFHNTILGKYYSIRDAGTETITLILILTS